MDYRLCVDVSHTCGWQCARCNRTYCWTCDRMGDDGRPLKTAVRWCQDWRCQREEKIERGEDEATKLKRALAEALEMVRMHSDDYDYVSPRERVAELRLLL